MPQRLRRPNAGLRLCGRAGYRGSPCRRNRASAPEPARYRPRRLPGSSVRREHHGRGHARPTKRTGEGRGLPVPMPHRRPTTLAVSGQAAKARHLGRGSGLVDEDQALGIKVRLSVEPCPRPGCDVLTLLLAGMYGFGADRVTVQKAPQRTGRERRHMITAQQLRQLDKRNILPLLNHVQDHRPMGLDMLRARVITFGLRRNDTTLPEHRNPANCGNDPDL